MIFKLLLFLLFLSITEVIKEGFAFVLSMVNATPYNRKWYQKLELMAAISYILTITFSGFGL